MSHDDEGGVLTIEAREAMLPDPDAKPGNFTFRPGSAPAAGAEQQQLPGGDFIFELPDGSEFMRIRPDGWVTVRDRTDFADDEEVYKRFSEWLRHALGKHDGRDYAIKGGDR